MYAVVEIAGQQFKVTENQKVFVHQLPEKEGENVHFNKVLMLINDDSISVGDPTVKGAEVTAKVLNHSKGDKVIVFKKKRRKGYRVKNGHRQHFTEIQIEQIVASGKGSSEKSTTATKKESAPKVASPSVKEEVKTADFDSMKVADLRQLAKDKDIQGYSKMKKDELISALTK